MDILFLPGLAEPGPGSNSVEHDRELLPRSHGSGANLVDNVRRAVVEAARGALREERLVILGGRGRIDGTKACFQREVDGGLTDGRTATPLDRCQTCQHISELLPNITCFTSNNSSLAYDENCLARRIDTVNPPLRGRE